MVGREIEGPLSLTLIDSPMRAPTKVAAPPHFRGGLQEASKEAGHVIGRRPGRDGGGEAGHAYLSPGRHSQAAGPGTRVRAVRRTALHERQTQRELTRGPPPPLPPAQNSPPLHCPPNSEERLRLRPGHSPTPGSGQDPPSPTSPQAGWRGLARGHGGRPCLRRTEGTDCRPLEKDPGPRTRVGDAPLLPGRDRGRPQVRGLLSGQR